MRDGLLVGAVEAAICDRARILEEVRTMLGTWGWACVALIRRPLGGMEVAVGFS